MYKKTGVATLILGNIHLRKKSGLRDIAYLKESFPYKDTQSSMCI